MLDSLRYNPVSVSMVRRQLSQDDLAYVKELSTTYNLEYEELLDAFAEACLDYMNIHYQGFFFVSRAAVAIKSTGEDQVFYIYHQKKQG